MAQDKTRQRLEARLARTRPGTGHHRNLSARLAELDTRELLSRKVKPVSEKVETKAEAKAPTKEKKIK